MMKRRNFLHATLVTAGAAIAGCDGDETNSTTGDTTTTTSSTEPPRTLEPGDKYFPQSVASGDPKPDSVILWTRVQDDDVMGAKDLKVELELSADPDFKDLIYLDKATSIVVDALAAFDHCVKVRLASISPATTYYYRFIYETAGKYYVSKVGKTKTAPEADKDVPVKFAYVSCQDYIGRYYNTYARLVKEPLDFFVHLGDYVYETEGDPTFQNTSGRKVKFSDVAGSIELTAKDKDGNELKYHAAKSLSNYRDLYRTYRADPNLQAMHESFPMIATWDDHEFSDDCHGATASYFDGRQDETDVDRRKAADQAWFEYMPVDYLDNPDFAYDAGASVPGDIKIWRDFGYGKHLHLVMTDLRAYRADHIIPEEAFPGAVAIDEDALVMEYGQIPMAAKPYLDIDDAMWSDYKTALIAAVKQGGGDEANVKGNISVAYINSVVTAAGAPPPIDDVMQMDMKKGIAYIDAAKVSLYSSVGSRYFAIKPVFDILARFAQKAKKQDVMGSEQEKWFLSTVQGSTKTWKVWGNEYCLATLGIDLTMQPVPANFQQQFYMNLDSWDGFPDKRAELIDKLSGVPNVVAITGDIHAFYAATPTAGADTGKKIVELVGSSVSSGTFKSLIKGQVAADPVLSSIPAAMLLADVVDSLLKGKHNPTLAHADSASNGFVVVDISATELLASYHGIVEAEVTKDHSKDDDKKLDALFKVTTFKTVAGEHELYKKQDDGGFKKWDIATQTYI